MFLSRRFIYSYLFQRVLCVSRLVCSLTHLFVGNQSIIDWLPNWVMMGPESQVNATRTLEHVHGVHVVQHSPFVLEEISQNGNFHQSTHGRLAIGVNQLLRVHTVQWVPQTYYGVAFRFNLFFTNIKVILMIGEYGSRDRLVSDPSIVVYMVLAINTTLIIRS